VNVMKAHRGLPDHHLVEILTAVEDIWLGFKLQHRCRIVLQFRGA
jgi:hypothetical protein